MPRPAFVYLLVTQAVLTSCNRGAFVVWSFPNPWGGGSNPLGGTIFYMASISVKEDRISIQKKVASFIEARARVLAFLALAVLLVGGGVVWNQRRQAAIEKKAAETLRQAVALLYVSNRAGKPDLKSATAAFEGVLRDYPETPSAAQASLYLGHIYYSMEDYASSLEHYRKAASIFQPDSPFFEVTLLDIAYTLEAMGNYPKAREAYQRVLGMEKGVLKDRAAIGIGRCYEQEGKIKKAIETYSSLLKKFPNSPWAKELRRRLDILKELKTS